MKNTSLKTTFPFFNFSKMRVILFFILRSMGMSPKGKPRSEGRLGQQNTLTLTSSAFENNGMIPRRYTCEGENISPPLEISNIPSEAQSLALIVHDGDAPVPGGWTHWLLFNIDSMSAGQISENSIPRGAVEGQTSFGVSGYGGPCPPSGTHHYEFKLYALDSELALDEKAKKADLEHAMEGHVVGITNLIGLYSKQN